MKSNRSQHIGIAVPPRFKVRSEPHRLAIIFRWISPWYVGLALFCLFWDAFIVYWYVALPHDAGLPLSRLIPLPHIVIGLWSTYIALAGLMNSTTIEVDSRALQVRSGPLPYPGGETIRSSDIVQLYAKVKSNRGLQRMWSISFELREETYQVHVLTEDGEHTRLISGLDVLDNALFIEQEVEEFLGIQEARVRKEIPR